MRSLKIFVKATIFFLWCFLLAPLQAIFLKFNNGQASYAIPQLWQKGICFVFGIKVIVEGTPLKNKQTLFICNHISYLDIPVLASVLRASFVAKKEVAGWPVFGTLARLQQTAFISRSRADAQKEKNALTTMLNEGKSLILFPEGTSTDGRIVVPFKSSLFGMALDDNRNDMLVQPVTLRVEEVDGKSPDDQTARDLYAWYGDMTMPPHLKDFTAGKGAIIRVIFHDPVDPKAFSDRKTLSDACWIAVQSGIHHQNLANNLAA
jgi:1-acyl-sn-glycerol-3-phosphate acyltransferase